MKKIRLLPAVAFFGALLAGSITLFASPKETRSETERRLLAEAPELTSENVLSGWYFERLDLWTADHFPKRELFRQARAAFQIDILREHEYNGFVRHEGSIIRLQKQANEASFAYAGERFERVRKKYLERSKCSVYRALVPDKSSFLRDAGYPVADGARMEELYGGILPFATAVPIRESLELTDYYRTDSHWRQERLINTAEILLQTMGRDTSVLRATEFDKVPVEHFLGVYAGQSAMNPEPETLYYLTGGYLDDCRIFDYETMSVIPMYDPEGCDARDLYTLFVGGSKSLLRIDNPNASEGELIIFRDSFGAAIAPLLASAYRSVYLADIRYIHPDALGRFLKFADRDVLFLYSETLMNNSQGLR